MIELSIIILNWNGKRITEECLLSLEFQLNKNIEVIVVDNHSNDGSSEYLKKRFPWIKLIKSSKNLGYAGGNNLGVKNSKGRYLLVLNNDIIVEKNFIKEIIRNRKKADILGVKNYYYGYKNLLWAIGSKLNKYTFRASLIGNKKIDSSKINKTKVEFIVGSAMLINREVIKKIGFLNEKFFLYYEETEWQLKAKKAGFKIDWIPSAKLWHRVAFSTGGGRTPISSYYLVRNRAYCIKKFSDHKLISYSSLFLEIIARFIYGLIKFDLSYSFFTIKGILSFFKGENGECAQIKLHKT
jgi:hypothetical protein